MPRRRARPPGCSAHRWPRCGRGARRCRSASSPSPGPRGRCPPVPAARPARGRQVPEGPPRRSWGLPWALKAPGRWPEGSSAGADRRQPPQTPPTPGPCRLAPTAGSPGLPGASPLEWMDPEGSRAACAGGRRGSPGTPAAAAAALRTGLGRPRPPPWGRRARMGPRSTCAPRPRSAARCRPPRHAWPRAHAAAPRTRRSGPRGRRQRGHGGSACGRRSSVSARARSTHPASGQNPTAARAPTPCAAYAAGRRARSAARARKATAPPSA
mmetsp:Transcript_81726/g.243704  ORF Transcript_81726/g.243704 Transcript_81726/m.243704 type:complete len:269 (+) Transcript_81726:579-1385(+)